MTNEDIEETLNVIRQYMEENALAPRVQDAFELVEKTLMAELSYHKS